LGDRFTALFIIGAFTFEINAPAIALFVLGKPAFRLMGRLTDIEKITAIVERVGPIDVIVLIAELMRRLSGFPDHGIAVESYGIDIIRHSPFVTGKSKQNYS